MKINPLPPQAYTKETLQKAYAWLLNQSASVKDMATTQDMLISLYLKAQRSGENSLDTPSIQNFKQELKSLSSMIGELQPPQVSTSQNPSLSTSSMQSKAQALSSTQIANTSDTNSNNNLSFLDPRSLQILDEVKQTLNLSSEVETLRMLISLGHKQFKKMN